MIGYTDAQTAIVTTVQLNPDEFITHMNLDFTEGTPFLTRLDVITTIRTLGPYGAQGSHSFSTAGNKLLYATGRSGPMIDQLILHYEQCI